MSQIDGYIYEEETIVNSSLKDKGASAGIGFGKLNSEGKIGKQDSFFSTKNVKITDASKLDKIFKNEGNIKYGQKFKQYDKCISTIYE